MEVLRNRDGVTRFTSEKNIKIKCKDCKYYGWLYCQKFRQSKNEFTGESEGKLMYKKDLNSSGECVYYERATWLKRLLNN